MLNEDQFQGFHDPERFGYNAKQFDNGTPPTSPEGKRAVMHMMRAGATDYKAGEGVRLRGWGQLERTGKYWAHLQLDRQQPSLRAMYFHDPTTGETAEHTWKDPDTKPWREWNYD